MPEEQRQECVAGGSLVLGGVLMTFLQPPYAEKSYVVVRAVVGDVPPQGQCETLYQLVLEVQGMLCGPHTPVVCLDWPARRLLVSCSLDMSTLSGEDAAAVMVSMQRMAVQWRDVTTQTDTGQASKTLQSLAHR